MSKTVSLTGWKRARAAAAEGIYYTIALLLWAAESISLLLAFQHPSLAAYGAAAGIALVCRALAAPLRLGRMQWYLRCQTHPDEPASLRLLFSGFRHSIRAVRWRLSIWWRHTLLMTVALLPGQLLWGYGDALSRQGQTGTPFMWFLLGGIALLTGWAMAELHQCRYALTPLLILRGYSASMALHLSIEYTHHRTGEWVNFWGRQAGRLLASLIPPVCLWLMPPVRLSYTALLTSWLPEEQSLEHTRIL